MYEESDFKKEIQTFEPLFESIPQIILGLATLDTYNYKNNKQDSHMFNITIVNLIFSCLTVAYFSNNLTHRVYQNKLFCFRLIKSIFDFITILSFSLQLGLLFRKNVFIGCATYFLTTLFSYVYFVSQDSIHKNQKCRRICLNIKIAMSDPFI